ncbi:hypothetical protein D915_011238 [Fasciola hepatica]|uniref:Uncharacterized protein n=1 Tax=Fasciola hepatica TaxID=6192 RepID=A0A4E0QSM8_FASHE|nr:hypothetical protein D915_011238 [Fasciola hepatica]
MKPRRKCGSRSAIRDYQQTISNSVRLQVDCSEPKLPVEFTDRASNSSSANTRVRTWVQASSKFPVTRECLPTAVVIPSVPESCLKTSISQQCSSPSIRGWNTSPQVHLKQNQVELPRVPNSTVVSARLTGAFYP